MTPLFGMYAFSFSSHWINSWSFSSSSSSSLDFRFFWRSSKWFYWSFPSICRFHYTNSCSISFFSENFIVYNKLTSSLYENVRRWIDNEKWHNDQIYFEWYKVHCCMKILASYSYARILKIALYMSIMIICKNVKLVIIL